MESAKSDNYEKFVADKLNSWFKKKHKPFKAKKSTAGNLFSDVEVTNTQTKKVFYIECKLSKDANAVNISYQLDSSCNLIPVHGQQHQTFDLSIFSYLKLATENLQSTKEYLKFKAFLTTFNDDLYDDIRKLRPIDVWNGHIVSPLSKKNVVEFYNKNYMNSQYAKLQPISNSITDKASAALAWWKNLLYKKYYILDIATIQINSYMSLLTSLHYQLDKANVKYICVGDLLYAFNESDDPLNIKCNKWPDDLNGIYTLRFKRDRSSSSNKSTGNTIYRLTTRASITSNMPESVNINLLTNFYN